MTILAPPEKSFDSIALFFKVKTISCDYSTKSIIF